MNACRRLKKLEAYFNEIGIRLYLGDVVETLNQLPEESIDFIFADPPYNLSNDGFTCHAGKRVSVNKGKWDKSQGFEDDFNFHYNWIEACKRVLKPNGSLWISGTYHSIYVCGFALQKQGWHIVNDICWYKPNAAPNLSCRMFTASHETLLWVKKDKKAKHTFNYEAMKNGDFPNDCLKKPNKQMRSIWAIGTPKNGEKKYGKHPTQKPEPLLERLILAASNEYDIVLDPFCGSATTGVAALRYTRKFVGIDLEPEYFDKYAIPRLKDELLMKNNIVIEKESEYGLLP
jgi:site-specific DNA-methyltransferase (adenine-specific)